jgi:hypothetical protein
MWAKIKENLASFKVWAFAVLALCIRFTPGLTEVQASAFTHLADLAFGANVAITVAKTVGDIVQNKKAPNPRIQGPGETAVATEV